MLVSVAMQPLHDIMFVVAFNNNAWTWPNDRPRSIIKSTLAFRIYSLFACNDAATYGLHVKPYIDTEQTHAQNLTL